LLDQSVKLTQGRTLK